MQTRFHPADHPAIWDREAIARGPSRRTNRPTVLALAVVALAAPLLAVGLGAFGKAGAPSEAASHAASGASHAAAELGGSAIDHRPVGTVFAPMDWGHEL